MKYALIVILSVFAHVQFVCASDQSTDKSMQQGIAAVQKQLDELVVHGGKYAYLQLAKKDGLKPFAVAINKSGDTLMLEVTKADEEATFAQKIIKLRDMLKLGADKGEFDAVALFVQAKVPFQGKDVDGIAIEMEHLKGLSALRFSPYEIDRDKQKINFQQPVDKIKPVVFFKDIKKKANKS